MTGALAQVTELQDALSHFDGRELRRQIEKLQAVHAWASKFYANMGISKAQVSKIVRGEQWKVD